MKTVFERGAALTETFVLMLALTPIMFGIPMIGKLIDLRQTTVQASRYGAWEATVRGSDNGVPTDINDRFFSAPGVSINGDVSAPNPLWGRGAALPLAPTVNGQTAGSFGGIDQTAVVLKANTGAGTGYTSAYDAGAGGAVALKVQKFVEKAGKVSSKVTGVEGKWVKSNPATKGLVRSEVVAAVEGNGWFEELTSTDATVIMYNNWSSGNDDQAKDRSRSMVPAGALEKPANMFASFGAFPLFKELLDLKDAFGRVDMNPLPADEKRKRALKPFTEAE